MIDGIITPALRDIDYLTPAAPYPVNPSGVMVGQQTIYRYAIPTDEQLKFICLYRRSNSCLLISRSFSLSC